MHGELKNESHSQQSSKKGPKYFTINLVGGGWH